MDACLILFLLPVSAMVFLAAPNFPLPFLVATAGLLLLLTASLEKISGESGLLFGSAVMRLMVRLA